LAFTYLVERRVQPLESMNQGDAHEVSFEIHRDDLYTPDAPVLSGVVDWQDGVNFYYQQFIDPGEFTEIMACAFEAVKEARIMIGERWCQSEPK
jgi:hypothetical protein